MSVNTAKVSHGPTQTGFIKLSDHDSAQRKASKLLKNIFTSLKQSRVNDLV